jgi:hypothetical protein
MKFIFGIFVILIITGVSFSQIDTNLILGQSQKSNSAALFDLSDPTGINMEVNLWGYIRFPGRYRVPVGTNFIDILSFAGGPTDESNLEEVRILRNTGDPSKKPELIKLNYDDLLWEDKISSSPKLNPVLQPGDVIVVLKEKRYTFRDNLSVYIPIFSAIVSVATFIITINR